jgi:hypothetical protein
MATTLFPTHHCFDDALEFLGARVARHPALARGRSLRLVHGICLGPRGEGVAASFGVDVVAPGQPFAHAWVEEATRPAVVWQSGLDAAGGVVFVAIPRSIFYGTMRVGLRTRYTVREAWHENQRTGTYGPWKAEYRALCRTPAPKG